MEKTTNLNIYPYGLSKEEIKTVEAKYENKKKNCRPSKDKFELTLDQFMRLYATKKDYYTDLPLAIADASLHQVIPSDGYVIGNVVLVDIEFNRRVGGLSPKQQMEVAVKSLKFLQGDYANTK